MRLALPAAFDARGPGAGGQADGFARHVRPAELVGRVAEVEALGPGAAHFAGAEVARATASQGQGVFNPADEDDLFRISLKRDGGGRESTVHVDDDDGAGGFSGALQEALEVNVHGMGPASSGEAPFKDVATARFRLRVTLTARRRSRPATCSPRQPRGCSGTRSRWIRGGVKSGCRA